MNMSISSCRTLLRSFILEIFSSQFLKAYSLHFCNKVLQFSFGFFCIFKWFQFLFLYLPWELVKTWYTWNSLEYGSRVTDVKKNVWIRPESSLNCQLICLQWNPLKSCLDLLNFPVTESVATMRLNCMKNILIVRTKSTHTLSFF